MPRILSLIIFFSLALGREDLVRIKIVSPNDLVILEEMGVEINHVENNWINAESPSDLIPKLKAIGYQIETLVEGIDRIYQKNFDKGRYLTYDQFRDTMVIIANTNPQITKLETLGTTVTGRLILAMKISDNAHSNENEPVIYIDGDMHGDEKIGWAVCFEMIKFLLTNYQTNPNIKQLVDAREIWIAPTVNPDGYFAGTRGNSRGYDLNRTFGYAWEFQASNDAFTENESRALREHLEKHPPVIGVSYHAGTVVTLYPWSYTPDSSLEKALLDSLARQYSGITRYTYGQWYYRLYESHGTLIDQIYGIRGGMAFTPEICIQKTPPAESIDAIFNNREQPGMLYFIRKSKAGLEGLVTDSTNGRPLSAIIKPSNAYWPSYSDSAIGDYHRFLLPGNYTLRVDAQGYREKIISGINILADTSVVLNIRLAPQPNESLYAFKTVLFCQRGNYIHTAPHFAFGKRDGLRHSLGIGGWAVFDMQYPIVNLPGNDFFVVENDGDAEICTVFVSQSPYGPWTRLGVTNGTTAFDLSSGSVSQARYIKLRDDGDGSQGPTAGFDLDAIEARPIQNMVEENRAQNFNLKPEFIISPNPFTTRTVIQCRNWNTNGTTSRFSLKIFDSSGRLIRSFTINLQDPNPIPPIVFDGRNLSAGVYFVALENQGKLSTGKVVKLQ